MTNAGVPGYRETDAGWIPEAWAPLSLGTIASARKTKAVAQQGVRCVELEHIQPETGRLLGWDSSGAQASIKTAFKQGDVLFGKLRPYLRKYAVAPFDGICTTEILAIHPKDDLADRSFLFQLMQGDGVFSTVEALSYGTKMPRVSWSDLAEIVVGVPSLAEQRRVAAILAAVDDKLDLIARQIEATQTFKQGLMQTLFSRGVGTQDANGHWLPHAEFKETELGGVPSCWDVQRLEALSESITVGIATSTTEHYADSGIPLIRNQNIKDDFLDLSDLLRITPEFDAKNKNKRVKAGDILTVRTGYPGTTCVMPEGLGLLQTFTTLITRPRHDVLHAHFASRYFNSPQGKKLMLHQAAGGAQQNINAGNLKKLLVPVPPLSEQVRIAEVLAAVDAKIRVLSDKSAHYQTMKRGLMQKLLTGEWRVKMDAELAA
ncbi:MAG: restriction endonuclease subunit S [Burkholderiaceae bacterium]|nr:restriction endonuclease subunit S [Burkholderiaceae bacterium]